MNIKKRMEEYKPNFILDMFDRVKVSDFFRFFKKRIISIFNILLYYLLSIFPRRKDLWVFGSGFGYTDNSKYLFEEVIHTHREIEAIWITLKYKDAKILQNRGIKAYWNKSPRGWYLTLRAKVFVYTGRTNDINFVTSKTAFKFCLWHGAMIKEIEFMISRGPLVKRYDNSIGSRIDYACCYQKPDLLLTTGSVNSVHLKNSMRVGDNHCVSNIYPRCKILILTKKQQLDYLHQTGGLSEQLYEITRKYKKVYVYMPTFRDGRPYFLEEARFDLCGLNEVLIESDSFLILKVHPNTIPYLKIRQDYSNIFIVRESFDIYPLLPFINILITDYSSIYFDFLYLRKGIILFPFDLENFILEDRPFVVDYNNDIKAMRAESFEQLLELIKTGNECMLSDSDFDDMMQRYNSNNNIDLANYVKKMIGF